ncbi:unnamed protein product [Orchesella dallaii]|uniref:F-box domain-containing protein n=1 Tax=Orchesella dallaii TaxID=48710 RepID=A0ABP1RMI5_9HEXA
MAIPPPLPLEMIEHIFNQLTDPHDFNTVINSHPLWNDLMRNQKTNRLFDLVLPAMMKVATYDPTLADLQILRQVNRNWKQAVDHQLQVDPGRFVSDSASISPTPASASRFYPHQRTANEYLTYANSLIPGSNPFLGNYAQFYTADRWEQGQPNNDFLPLLQHYGQHLQRVGLVVNSLTLEEFIHIMELLPNLERMWMSGALINERLADGLAFPQLPFFTTLYLGCNERFLVEVLEQLLSSLGSTLTSLSCGSYVFQIGGLYQLLPNLRKLYISQFDNGLEEIQALSHIDLPLEELGISSELPYLPINQEYMNVVNHFSTTLIYLKIDAHLVEGFDVLLLQNFVKLETLELKVCTEVLEVPKEAQLKLVSVCPKLKELKVLVSNGRLVTQVIHVSTMMKQMSEIFSDFVSKLRTFELRSRFIPRS